MIHFKRWALHSVLALLVAVSLGGATLEDPLNAVQEEAPTGCSYCIIYDRKTGETIQYWFEDPESDVTLEGSACDCE